MNKQIAIASFLIGLIFLILGKNDARPTADSILAAISLAFFGISFFIQGYVAGKIKSKMDENK